MKQLPTHIEINHQKIKTQKQNLKIKGCLNLIIVATHTQAVFYYYKYYNDTYILFYP